ncbi:MAG TPA: 50S ribosomal protein L25 [Anaerovoracaceae bacterium]|nr:50S ribosomal protein L25 [Anaerovoracaceae bacterium]
MEVTILKATERSEKPKKVRDAGFIPGVLNAPGTTSASVQFETKALNRIIMKHGTNAKIWVELGSEKKFGFVKEVQTHPVQRNIIHVAIQLVSQDQEIKMQLPILFQGSDELEQRLLRVHVNKSEVEVVGKAALIPDMAVVDVSEKKSEDNVTAIDFHLPAEIKILDPEHEVYAIIKAIREGIAEKPEEEEATPAE